MDIMQALAKELNLSVEQVEKTVALLDEGNTVPFIARYRKEVTGSLDDVALRKLEDRLHYLRKLDERRAEIAELIRAQEKLTPEISTALDRAVTLVELEDIYRPFRPKRKTRASVARERGLGPLAELIAAQNPAYTPSIPEAAAAYVREDGEVPDADAALAGALDILAEDISNEAEYRKMLRAFTVQNGSLVTSAAKEEDSVYKDYYAFNEPIRKLRPHRILAINRGEKEGFLKVSIELPEEEAIAKLAAHIIKDKNSPAVPYLMRTIRDSYDRLIFPSIEREIRSDLFDEACEGALRVFADNLRNLLMISPLKGKTVLGYDPGYRTGCKLAVVDSTGKVLDTAVIYPTKPREDIPRSRETVIRLIRRYAVDVVAIGNGTASRESEQFIAETLRSPEINRDVRYTIVSEAGASVYSASKLGAEEFPDFDVTERSAVSIARRLQDPLAELVKIEPQAIGVGQYQHDMKPARLSETLGGVVEDCVNAVGVDVNTASYSLLSYIAGISASAAKSIVAYREENGEFRSRAQILKVPKIGQKAYEQCAGFLRVPDSEELLDNTGVHPESYELTGRLLALFGYTKEDVRSGQIGMLRAKITLRGIDKVCAQLSCGEPTLLDIVAELEKPGRDIRDTAPAPVLRSDVLEMKDLKEGMLLRGTVRNVVDFGAFVDIGVHEDGLLHVSEMSDRFISHPREMVSVGDVIEVRIKSVDLSRKRISLSCKNLSEAKN